MTKAPFDLKQEYIDAFKRDGYVVIPNVFSDEDCDKFLRYIRRHANKDFAAIVNPDRYQRKTR